MNANEPQPLEAFPFLAPAIADRRAQPRLSAEILGVDADATLAMGVPARILNLSGGGALLEIQEWIRPGTSSQLRLSRASEGDDARVVLAGRVVRCWVDSLSPLRYKAVIWFTASQADRSVTVDESRPHGAGSIAERVEPDCRAESGARPCGAPDRSQPAEGRRRTWY